MTSAAQRIIVHTTPPEMSCAEADFIGQFAAYQQQYAARIAELTERWAGAVLPDSRVRTSVGGRFERDRATFDGRLKEAAQATQAGDPYVVVVPHAITVSKRERYPATGSSIARGPAH